MAGVQVQNRLYEILMRVNEDGSYGAHYKTITIVSMDGQVISAREEAPIPIDESNTQAMQLLSGLIGDASAQTAIQIEQLKERNRLLETENASFEELIAQLTHVEQNPA